MKLKLCVLGCIIAAITIIICVTNDDYFLTYASRIVFKFLLLAVFLSRKKLSVKSPFYFFFGIAVLTDVLSFLTLKFQEFFFVPIAILFFGMYVILLRDASSQFRIKNVKSVVGFYYFFVIIVNAGLVLLHLYNLSSYVGDQPFLYIGLIMYNLVLYSMIVLSLAYYLNSYSRKSMFFLIGTLTFVCSDILLNAFYIYKIEDRVIFFSAALSLVGYIFFFNYFFTKEVPLQVEDEILKELKELKRKSKTQSKLPIRPTVK